MKTILLECEFCGGPFERALKEHKRNQKLGRRTFCDLSCANSYNNLANPRKGDVKNFKGKNRPRPLDELSPFRWYLHRILARKEKSKDTDITTLFLKALWEEQKGICPYTGLLMELPIGCISAKIDSPLRASLDRIDSSKPYRKNNVEFVCVSINYAKNGFTKDQMKKFIDAIRNPAKV